MDGGLEQIGLGAVLDFDAGAAIGEMHGASSALESLRHMADRVGEGIKHSFSGIKEVVKGLGEAALEVGAVVGEGLHEFANQQEAMLSLATVLPGGEAAAKGYEGAVEELAITYGKSGTVIAGALGEVARAHVAVGDELPYLDRALKLAVGAKGEPTDAVHLLARATKAYGDQIKDTGLLADQFAVARKAPGFSLEALAGSMGAIMPVAAEAHVSIEQILASMETMADKGIDAGQSAQALRMILGHFIQPSKEVQLIAHRIGFDFSIAHLKAVGFANAMAELNTKAGGSEEIMRGLAGDMRTFKAMAALGGEGADQFKRNLDELANAAGTVDRDAATMASGLKFEFEQLVEVGKQAAERVGEAFAEVFLGAAPAMDPKAIKEALEELKQKAIGVFEAIKQGFIDLGVVEAYSEVKRVLKEFGEDLDKHFGQGQATKMAGMAGAVVVLGGAFAGLGLILTPVTAILSGAWEIVAGVGEALGGLLGIGGGAEATGLTGLLSGVSEAVGGWGPLGAIIGTLGAVIGAFVGDAGGKLAWFTSPLGVGGVRTTFMELAGTVWGVLKDAFEFLGTIASALAPVFGALSEVVGEVLSPIFHALSDALGGVWKVIKPLLDIVGGVARIVFGALAWVLHNVVAPALGWIMITVEKVGQEIKAVFEWLGEAFSWVADKVRIATDALGLTVEKLPDKLKPISAATEIMRAHDDQVRQVADAYEILTTQATNTAIAVEQAAAAVHASEMGYGKELTDEILNQMAGARVSQVNATSKAVSEHKSTINVHSVLSVDGKHMNVANSRAQLEIVERSGGGVTPWQRRVIMERGASLATSGSGI